MSTSSALDMDGQNCSSAYFDLGLGDDGLRIGHWNVSYLTSAKFDQIKLFLLVKSSPSSPQLDILFLCETFLKRSVPDSLYAVPGFSIYRRERLSRGGGGIMALINQDLTTKRGSDLENHEIEGYLA